VNDSIDDLRVRCALQAAEIERLRAERVDVWADQQTPIKWRDVAEHYRRENEKGMEALAAHELAQLRAVIGAHERYRDQQRAEIERLRAALEFVADERSGETLAARMRRAREALKK
jgi:uncharacterized small protein (DUF1192 family)